MRRAARHSRRCGNPTDLQHAAPPVALLPGVRRADIRFHVHVPSDSPTYVVAGTLVMP